MRFRLVEDYNGEVTEQEAKEFMQLYPQYINNNLGADYIWIDQNGDALGYNTSHYYIIYDIVVQLPSIKEFAKRYGGIENIDNNFELYDIINNYVYDLENYLFYNYHWIQLGAEHNELYVANKETYNKQQLYTVEDYLNQSPYGVFTVAYDNRAVKYNLSVTEPKDIITNIRRYQNGQSIIESLNEEYEDEINYLADYFNATDNIPEGATFIIPDGRFLNISSYSGKKRQKGFNYPTHDIVDQQIKSKYKNSDEPYVMTSTVGGLPFVRLNDGKFESGLCYIDLSNVDNPTREQYNSIEMWLDKLNSNRVEVLTYTQQRSYNPKSDGTDYIINRIKRFYASGKLYESRRKA